MSGELTVRATDSKAGLDRDTKFDLGNSVRLPFDTEWFAGVRPRRAGSRRIAYGSLGDAWTKPAQWIRNGRKRSCHFCVQGERYRSRNHKSASDIGSRAPLQHLRHFSISSSPTVALAPPVARQPSLTGTGACVRVTALSRNRCSDGFPCSFATTGLSRSQSLAWAHWQFCQVPVSFASSHGWHRLIASCACACWRSAVCRNTSNTG